MKDYLVLDLETQHEFSEVGGRAYPHLLKISVAGVYSYKKDKFMAFEEDRIGELEKMIKDAGLVIGFNTKYFDYQVLQPYLKEVDLKNVPSCDIMEDLANVLGHRLSLDSVAKATLNTKKSGHGLDAIKYFREGRMDELKSYCLDDVRITRDVFDYGRKYGQVFFNEKGSEKKLTAPVYWDEYNVSFKSNISIKENTKESIDEPQEKVEYAKEDAVSQNYSLFN
ncbi:ribonuclease H-like domain-containing protein [Candidatus Azambacteria bacterium]|nr:ribonuclease H-like domain-containing protein [Candidatus Azambacteria bacterium]